MQVFHPTAKMLVELSKSQDIEAGDGTTSVCVIAGALLNACTDLLAKGIHPMAVAESFLAAADKAETILEGMATPVDLANRYVCKEKACEHARWAKEERRTCSSWTTAWEASSP